MKETEGILKILEDGIESILQMSPEVMMAFVIMGLGWLLKTKSPINSNWVPWILVAIGGAVYPFIAKTADIDPDIPYPAVAKIGYGMAISAVAIAIYELGLKRFLGGKKMSGDLDLSKLPKPDTKETK